MRARARVREPLSLSLSLSLSVSVKEEEEGSPQFLGISQRNGGRDGETLACALGDDAGRGVVVS